MASIARLLVLLLFAATVHAAEAPPPLASIDVADLDAGHASMPLDQWLQQTLGVGWTFTAGESLTDCGEQTGNGIQSHIPLCIEIAITSDNAPARGYLYIVVGSVSQGISGKPAFFFGTLDGRFFNRLSELSKLIVDL